jgi:mannose-6-phosphate isomerase-like protein (cupin superfamily)
MEGESLEFLKERDWFNKENGPEGVTAGKFAGSTCIFSRFRVEEKGAGPDLHKHPYEELLFIISGAATVLVGDEKLIAYAGDLINIPADTPHKFENRKNEILETIDINMSTQWIQEDLE